MASPPSFAPLPSAKLLTSWKEIAAYFGKGVRTVQRWEKSIDLPVHRPGNDRNIVFADPDELKAWALKAKLKVGNESAELSS
jgi:hypothetical protein